MKDYEVNVSLTMESNFDLTVEADSEDEARDLVKDQVWDDQLTQEIRCHREITSEEYVAEQVMEDFDIYDEDDEWVVTMYSYPDEATALEEYNDNLVGGEVAGDYAERR
jgi:hypothetical protein